MLAGLLVVVNGRTSSSMSNGIAHGDLILFDCPRIRKSEFWQFIKLVAPHASPPEGQTHWLSQDATDAFCLKCNKMLRFTKGSSNSVRRHMERFHRKELQKRQAQSAEAKKNTTTASKPSPATLNGSSRKGKRVNAGGDDEGAGITVGAAAAAATGAVDTLQPSKQRRISNQTSQDTRQTMEALVKWLAMSLRPLSIVEDPGFEGFAQALGVAGPFEVPSREALYHCLELMSETVRFDTKQKVKKEVNSFAISIDTWKAQISSRAPTLLNSHSAITCWYLSEDFSAQFCVLDIVPHASFAADKVARLLVDYSLQKAFLSVVAVEDSGVIEDQVASAGFRCVVNVSSTLNGLVSDLLSSPEPRWLKYSTTFSEATPVQHQLARLTIREALEDVLKVIQWVQSDAPAANQFHGLYPHVSAELLKFSMLEIRLWGIEAAHDTVSRAIVLRAALEAFLDQWDTVADADNSAGSMQSHKPKPESWVVLEGLLLLWRPLYEIHQVTANERVCSLPFVLPIVTMAKQHFERSDLFDDLKQRHASSIAENNSIEALDCARAELQRGFNHYYGEPCRSLCWVAALDPRYGRLRHLSDLERESAKEQLLVHALDLFSSQLTPVQPATGIESLASMVPSEFEGVGMYGGDTRVSGSGGGGVAAGSGLMHRLLFDEDEDIAPPSDALLARDAEIAQTRLYIADEIAIYFNEHLQRKARVPCPLEWWSANRERFPFLAPLARMWLCSRAGGKATSPSPRGGVLSAEVCESLGSSVEGVKWLSHARNLIELHMHLVKPPPAVSL